MSEEMKPGALFGIRTRLRSIEALLPSGGDENLPEQYIVPMRRDRFTADFQEIPEKIRPHIKNQGGIDSCVGHGLAEGETDQELVDMSPREIFRGAKLRDWRGLDAYGSYPEDAMQFLAEEGAAEDRLVPRDPAMGRAAYLKDDASEEAKANRKLHKSPAGYSVPRTLLRQTIHALGHSVGTGCRWYPSDNALGRDGILRMPTGTDIGGHLFACIGWVKRTVGSRIVTCLVMQNSFGPDWGSNGLFYVPLDGTENRLFSGFVSPDFPNDLAGILSRFNGKTVRVPGEGDHWQIVGGQRRRFPDEICFWAHGKLFGIDVFDIAHDELAVVPRGPDMDIANAPFASRELVRQIRQSVGLK